MELQEVYNLHAWLELEISDLEVIQKYSALQQALQQRAQNPNTPPYNEQKDSLLNTLKKVRVFGLSNPQLHVLEDLNILKHIGEEASEEIKEMMIEHASDTPYLAEQVKNKQAELQQGINHINTIFKSLSPIITDEELKLPKELILTRVTFKNEASIENINDLRKWTLKLFNITRGLAISCNTPVEDVKVEGASKGSLIFNLILGRFVASILTKTLKEIFQCMSEYQNFKIKANEAELAALKKDRFEKDYLQDKERWEERMDRVKQQVIEELTVQIKEEIEGFDDNNQNSLRTSVKDLVELITNGGDVDPVIPPVEAPDEDDEAEETNEEIENLENLRQDYIKLTELKHDLKLEHISDFAENTDDEENDI